MDILSKINQLGIIPVVEINNAQDGVPLAKALCDGGLPCAEITFRTSAAKDVIQIISKQFPDMLVGAGTVLTTKQVDEAVEAGARFIVSPGFNPKVVDYCLKKKIVIIPGCSNPGDIEQALEFGLKTVKFFPAEAAGGLPMIKAMAAPYSDMKFIPTGGINSDNLNSYLDFDKVLACGGSFMVPRDLINRKQFDEIQKLTANAVKKMLGFEIAHVGINNNSAKEAENVADAFERLLGYEQNNKETAFFIGTMIESVKLPFFGANGHIAIRTNYLNRAMAYLSAKNYEFREEGRGYDKNGKLSVVYLKEEIGGFALHLTQKQK